MKCFWLGIIVVIMMTGCSSINRGNGAIRTEVINSSNTTHEVELGTYDSAPELAQSIWLNTEKPLQIKDLVGKVILIDFWTFG